MAAADRYPGRIYKQKLARTLGGFSAFAAGFSYLSILTGIFQQFHVGFGAGGPAFFWTWPVVFLGQLMVALCFAELAAHYALAGSVYQWSKYIGSWAVGWMAGWIYLASYVISIAAVALALQITLPQIDPCFEILPDANQNAVLLGCILITFTTIVNAAGVGLLARINNVGVLAELLGAVILMVLLACHARHGPAILLDTQGRGVGEGFGYLGPLLAASIMASYVMYGFDTAGSLAEETTQPRRRVPWAILQALTAAAALGALLILFAMMAAPRLDAAELSQPDGGLPWIVKNALGGMLGKVFLCDVILAITVCTLAVHTGTVRLMFAMARDNNLPCSQSLARVSTRSRTPAVPALVAGGLAALILIVNVNFPRLIEAITSVAIVWANLAYLLVTGPLLVRRLHGWPPLATVDGRAVFSLGKWGWPVNVLAVVWGIALVLNIAWPRSAPAGAAWYEPCAAVLFTAILVSAGGVYYGVVQRHKTGILDEHRA